MAEPKAPAGGFKVGGWYEGRQWTGSSFGAPGVITVGSSAGQAVNPTVVAATNKEQGLAPGINEKYLASESLKTKEEVTPYLDNFQSTLYNSSTSPEVKVPTMEELKAELAPTTAKPALLNRASEFDKLRTSYGVADLEANLTDLKAQQDEQYAQLRITKGVEQGKPVAMNVIEGRMTEEERQYNEEADYLGRQVSRITDELNTKYNVINTYMNFMGLDYQDAVSAYDKEFAQNIQFYDLIAGARKEARSAYEYDQTAAKANLQIYANAVTSGNMSYGSLSPDQKLMIQKLEVQSGLPVGFISNLKMSPKDRLLGISDDKTQAWMIGENGNVSVVQTGMTKGTGTGTKTENDKEAQKEMSIFLTSKTNDYGHIGGDTYLYARNKWVTETGNTPDNFDQIFRGYRDPYNTGQYQLVSKTGEVTY